MIVWLGFELSVPVMVLVLPVRRAAVMTGKFCRLFGPVSASCASFGVTPSAPRSMPRCAAVVPLSWIELPRMLWLTPAVASTWTPSPPLKAMVLASPEPVPPTVLKRVPPPLKLMPFAPLPSALAPSAFVPMRLPWTRWLLPPVKETPSWKKK